MAKQPVAVDPADGILPKPIRDRLASDLADAETEVGASLDPAVAGLIDDTGSETRASLNATIATPFNDPDDAAGDAVIVHDAATKLITIRGAIRNDGDQSGPDHYWQPIVDANHQCDVGVASITTGTAVVNINFTRNLGKRVSCAVTPDNDLISKGWTVGASFSSGMLQLTFKRSWTITDELWWNGTDWEWAQGARFAVTSDTGGVLTISHEALKGRGMVLTPRTGDGTPADRQRYFAALAPDSGSSSSATSMKIGFYDRFTGALVTARTANEAGNLRVIVSRTWEGAVNPRTDINITDLPLHNVWFEATAHLTQDDAE